MSSLSLRFQIFKRDKFTCQYCGRKSPDARIELEHVNPRANGGTDDPSNLVTGCYDCNRGKAEKLLTDKLPAMALIRKERLEFLEEFYQEHKPAIPTDWLWPNRIPFDDVTLLEGLGLGNSLAAMYIVAVATSCTGWAECLNFNSPMEAIVVTEKNDTNLRLMAAAGADLEKVHILHSVGDLGATLEQNPYIRLVIIDSVLDPNPLNQFNQLIILAKYFHVAIVVTASPKATSRPNTIWRFYEDHDTGTRYIYPHKSLVSIGSLEYYIENKDLEIEGKTVPTEYIIFGTALKTIGIEAVNG